MNSIQILNLKCTFFSLIASVIARNMHVYIPLETSSVRLTFSFRKGKTMKKRSKKLVAILSAILVAASALAAVPVSAYWLPSQNREILYNDFDFCNQLTHYGSSLLLKKNEEGGLQK